MQKKKKKAEAANSKLKAVAVNLRTQQYGQGLFFTLRLTLISGLGKNHVLERNLNSFRDGKPTA